ncbi:YihY family inner membrane protein [Ectothiorhodospira haloalkaliphila]|uniref:YhjD/YihY/BrkB family envelope integrity protein n=1 Tax=Ectothiorhodospira haloalkaliphila TaxID=421628 RepID=UPI001EE835C8|nr:YhjD/YihY/BrkB family envelope integrity protein [Ectothiorhodospira haloalkaliphila]MCG5525126.1 YihY family inner membrane protein [Ectothiorhodospira haloalkaliphila]
MKIKEQSLQIKRMVEQGDIRRMSRSQAWSVGAVRAMMGIGREVSGGQLNLHAMSLVYTSLLSVVPLLALSFSVLKAFGAHNAVEPFLLTLLEPLGEQGEEVVANVVEFVENMRVGVLGFIGLIFLFFTVVGLIQKVEAAFNYIWHVHTPRNFVQKFSNYLSVILVGPVLVFSALGITGTVMATDIVQQAMEYGVVGQSVELLSKLVPYLLVTLAFTFIYVFVPNTHVRPLPALIGALVAAILWQSVGWGFASMMAGSTRYDAIYSGFAIMIMLLFWLYLNWLILLVGSQVAFYLQNPTYLLITDGDSATLSGNLQERLALRLMQILGARFYEGGEPLSRGELAHRVGLPEEALDRVLQALEKAGLVIPTSKYPTRYLPGRDLGQIALKDILDAVRGYGNSLPGEQEPSLDDQVARVCQEMEQALDGALASQSLRDLVHQQSKKEDGVSPGQAAST